jgi:glycosyltransferase involved in cell wall biosynthesis
MSAASAAGTKVTIVLPTHNGTRYIRQSIESCMAQSHRNWELVVVDDGSTDDTPLALREYADPRMRVFRGEPNQGLPAALNFGFRQATGDYFTWTSDDNWYAPRAIEEMARALDTRPDVGLVHADAWLVDGNGSRTGEFRAANVGGLERGNCVGACFLYRRSVYEAVGEYHPAWRLVEDYEYWLRVASRFSILSLNEPLYYYREHGESLTGKYGKFRTARMMEDVKLELGWTDRDKHAKRYAFFELCEGFEHYEHHNLAMARRSLLNAARLDPGCLKNRGVLSVLLQSVVGQTPMRAMRRLRRSGLSGQRTG